MFLTTGYNGGAALYIGNHYGADIISNRSILGEVGKDSGGDWWVNGTYFHGFFITIT